MPGSPPLPTVGASGGSFLNNETIALKIRVSQLGREASTCFSCSSFSVVIIELLIFYLSTVEHTHIIAANITNVSTPKMVEAFDLTVCPSDEVPLAVTLANMNNHRPLTKTWLLFIILLLNIGTAYSRRQFM